MSCMVLRWPLSNSEDHSFFRPTPQQHTTQTTPHQHATHCLFNAFHLLLNSATAGLCRQGWEVCELNPYNGGLHPNKCDGLGPMAHRSSFLHDQTRRLICYALTQSAPTVQTADERTNGAKRLPQQPGCGPKS